MHCRAKRIKTNLTLGKGMKKDKKKKKEVFAGALRALPARRPHGPPDPNRTTFITRRQTSKTESEWTRGR
jgi:hypothetical protein